MSQTRLKHEIQNGRALNEEKLMSFRQNQVRGLEQQLVSFFGFKSIQKTAQEKSTKMAWAMLTRCGGDGCDDRLLVMAVVAPVVQGLQ